MRRNPFDPRRDLQGYSLFDIVDAHHDELYTNGLRWNVPGLSPAWDIIIPTLGTIGTRRHHRVSIGDYRGVHQGIRHRLDHVWLNDYGELLLVVESEVSDRKPTEILRELKKLADVPAPLKLLICCPAGGRNLSMLRPNLDMLAAEIQRRTAMDTATYALVGLGHSNNALTGHLAAVHTYLRLFRQGLTLYWDTGMVDNMRQCQCLYTLRESA